MNIARRVNDAVEPDFVKIGTVWLPFPHLLLLPFVQSFALWQSGWAGAIVGIGCMALAAGALWRVGYWVGLRTAPRIIVVGVFVLNPSILYLYTISLTECVLITALLAALAGIARWAVADPPISPGELTVFAGVPTAAAVLSRYEGWAFAAAASVVIILISLKRWRSLRYTASLVFAYLVVPVVAAAWWISFNWVRFGDPLEFARGEYSAASQQAILVASGALPAQGNLWLSVWTYNWAVVAVVGVPLLVLAAIGGILLIVTRGRSITALVIWLAAFAYPFAIFSVYLGQTAIFNEHSLPAGLWNQRYAACLVPFVALLIGVSADLAFRRSRRIGKAVFSAILAVIIGFSVWSIASPVARIAVIGEGFAQSGPAAGTRVGSNGLAVASWVGDHYQGGDILIDETSILNLIQLRVPLSKVVGLYTGQPFENNLVDVSPSVTWVLADTNNVHDRVWTALKNNPSFRNRFAAVYTSGTMTAFKRIDSGRQ
ncbi:MAG TPA: hypothetical protein DDY88_00225 [Actinobacteria bacterium]|nr:hypothetical protein [Actinomycetota bacterium]